MKRIEALEILVKYSADLPIVATCAATSRELAHVADRPNHLYLLDSMGLTASVATGLALALGAAADRKVLALDGDGSLLMNLGSLATIGFLRPPNLILAVLDNASYASTAGIPTYTEHLDLGAIAAACGLAMTRATNPAALAKAVRQAIAAPAPHLLHVRIEPGNAPDIPLLLMDPVVLADRFSRWLTDRAERAAAGLT